MALSEELFPPTFVNGKEVPHPATIYSQPRPTMRPAQLSDEMFGPENAAGAHYMTPIDPSTPHHRPPKVIPPEELLANAEAAQLRTTRNRNALSEKFMSTGFPQLAMGVLARGSERIDEMQHTINTLRTGIDAERAIKIGATVVIPE